MKIIIRNLFLQPSVSSFFFWDSIYGCLFLSEEQPESLKRKKDEEPDG